MKSIWSTILPPAVLATEPEREFALSHSMPPDPQDADAEVATASWPMPPARAWAPAPARDSLFWQVVEALL